MRFDCSLFKMDFILCFWFYLRFICGESVFSLHFLPKIAKSWNSPQKKSFNINVVLKSDPIPSVLSHFLNWVMQYGCFSFHLKPMKKSAVCGVCVSMCIYACICIYCWMSKKSTLVSKLHALHLCSNSLFCQVPQGCPKQMSEGISELAT